MKKEKLIGIYNRISEEELKKVKEFNEPVSLIGEVGGAILPAFATGGTSLAARALAKTPAAIAAQLAQRSGSKAAQKVAEKIVGNGLKQTVARKAAEIGTTGFVVVS